MKSLEEHVQERLKELQKKQSDMNLELKDISVRIEELTLIVNRLANEPLSVPENKTASSAKEETPDDTVEAQVSTEELEALQTEKAAKSAL